MLIWVEVLDMSVRERELVWVEVGKLALDVDVWVVKFERSEEVLS